MRLEPGEIRASRVDDYDGLKNPGDFYYSLGTDGRPEYLTFWIPDSKELSLAGVHFLPGGWQFSGSLDCPSVSPSIWVNPVKNGWYGFLKEGKFRSVPR